LVVVQIYAERVQRAAMTRRMDELKVGQEISSKRKRSVLRNITLPGNAWDEYTLAFSDFKSWGKEVGNGGALFMYATDMLDTAEKEKTERVLISNRWRLDHLRQGAERADGQMPDGWYWKHQDFPGLLETRMLANLGAAQAKWLADRGRSQEAADVLLDVAVFGKDLSTTDALMARVGTAVYWTAFEELGRLLVARKFDAAILASLSRNLETLDRELPRLELITSDMTMNRGRYLLRTSSIKVGDPGWWSESRQMGWRFAISPRGYASAAFTEIDPYLQRFARLEDIPYATAITEATAIAAEGRKSSNFLVNDDMPNLPGVLAEQREVRAMLRVLRAGVDVSTTGDVPVLPDPFGTTILYRKDTHGVTVWSLGRDGKNQNGDGEFFYGPDIALTIPR
jgi:hypothetical protein